MTSLSRLAWRLTRVLLVVAAAAFLVGGAAGDSTTGDAIVVAGYFVLLLAAVLAWPALPAALSASEPESALTTEVAS